MATGNRVRLPLVPRGHFDRSPRKAETRARLLDAAGRVFAARGFAGATLDQVAEEAGYTKGAVYGHFARKEELLLALCEEQLKRTLDAQVDVFRRTAAGENPQAGADEWMAELRSDPDRFRLFVELWVHAQRDEKLRRAFAERLDELRKTFAGLVEHSVGERGIEAPPGAAEQLANVVIAMSNGMALMKLVDPKSVPDELLGATLTVLVGALIADPEARGRLSPPGARPRTG
jgi:AcrR family transcriptional regulator